MICSFDDITTDRRAGFQLKGFSFSVAERESIALLGTNGSGKSLIGRLLNGDLPIQTGNYALPTMPALVSFEKINAIIEEDNIDADITEATILNPGLTCSELIQRESGSDISLKLLLEQYGLAHRKQTAIRHLSTGEIAKALLIAALLSKPDLLILDEPFDGLDVGSRAVVAEAIEQVIQEGIAVVLLLNRLEEIPLSTSTVALMDHASIVLSGPRESMLKSEGLNHLFSLHRSLPETLPGEQRQGALKLDSEGRLASLKKVTIVYGDEIVINNADWDLYPGEHWKITGPNGCGKSTLLSLISGDHPQAYSNDITLFGRKRGTGETIWDIKREIGLVSTLLQRDYRVPGSILSVVLSGFHDSIGLYEQPSATEEREARQWLTIIGMAPKASLPFRRLSYGEQRMILIVRAMVKRPSILILDEPCLGLDPINRELVLHLVNHIAQNGNTTVLYVTHHDEDVIPAIQNDLKFVPAESGGYGIELS